MRTGEVSHELLGGKLRVFRRERSSKWQCATYLTGKEHRISARTDSLAEAKVFAEDWYLTLRGKVARGEVTAEKTFREAASTFEREYEVITNGERSPAYVRGHKDRLRLHLNPFFGSMGLSAVSAGAVQEYRVHRRQSANPPARTTLHHEIVTLRQVLKTGLRHGWISHLPDLTAPYRSSGKVAHRAWFSPEEYQQLYRATRARAGDKANHRRKAAEQLHDYVLFMANTGLRPDEAARLEYRDVLLTACSQSAPAAAQRKAVGVDGQAIAAQVKQRLENRFWFSFGEARHCSSAFAVGQPTITGQHIEGTSGEVEATVLITSLRDWPERSDPTDSCFGSPAGGFSANQVMVYTRTYPVQKWDTGWRLAPGP